MNLGNKDSKNDLEKEVTPDEVNSDTSMKKDQEEGVKTGQPGGENISPIQQIAELNEEIASLNDRLLRKQADFENFRKRLYREKDESVKYANQMLLLDITGVIDDFERAIKSSEESKDFEVFHNGIVMIEKQLVSILEKKWELKRYDSVGEVFNPEKHLAIAVEESSEYEVSTVLEDYQKGYLFHERVLRPAKVKVSQPIAKEDTTTDNNNQESDNDKE
ncbi:MAG: nucleotide exchange factor GrpE [Spirochaetales bacterium]|nr:nucleotide exchange factor GrpE [Spirochaetales bacterium]